MEESPNNNPSPQKSEQENKKPETSKAKSPIPQIENYIHPINLETLQSIQEVIEFTLKNYSTKLEQSKGSNLILKHKEIPMKLPEISSLFKEKELISEINDNEQYESIFDCVNFYHFVNNSNEQEENKQPGQVGLQGIHPHVHSRQQHLWHHAFPPGPDRRPVHPSVYSRLRVLHGKADDHVRGNEPERRDPDPRQRL